MSVDVAEISRPNFVCALKKIRNRYFRKTHGIHLYRRLQKLFEDNKEINELFSFEEFSKHYVYEPARQTMDHPDIWLNQVRYYRLYQYFKEHYSDMFSDDVTVVDVGDTSGVLFSAMKKKGISVNINKEVIECIRKKGIEARLGNAEHLEFEDQSVDYSFCFQCLEHLNNPLKALSELSRITRKNIFISIPYTDTTRIYSKQYWQELKSRSVEEGGWGEKEVREVDGHKFEFSAADFRKIVTHADLEYVDGYPINYFLPLGEKRKNEGSYFNFFILRPTNKGDR